MTINNDTFTQPSFSLKNRIARVIWIYFNILFFKYSPKICHNWRAMLLRLWGAKIGKNVHIYPKVQIWAPWNIDVGDESGIANGVILYSQGKIKIGSRTVISQGVHICAGTHDYTLEGFPLITKPITIGDNVWIAAEAFISPDIIIHHGVVIGARSVVTKDMPAWTVCAGNPCKPLKERILNNK